MPEAAEPAIAYNPPAAASAPWPALVVISHLRWDFVWQRPQHLLSRAAQEAPVIFVEEPLYADVAAPTPEVLPRQNGAVTILRMSAPHGHNRAELDRETNRLLADHLASQGLGGYVLWAYAPAAIDHLPALPEPAAVVFDVMDELSAFRGAPPKILDQEARLLARAQVVFTGGQSLYDAKAHRHGNIHCFPSSIEKQHFAQARTLTERPAEYETLPDGPRLGFYGVIDERFDTDLLREAAALRPGWQFVMLGPVVKIDAASLPQAPNIHYPGGRAYTELPAHLAAWDVALLPFARNESTRFISPTKTPEYLAAGKPTVSTSITDVVRPYGAEGLVHIADEPAEFVAAVERALAQKSDKNWLQQVDIFLADNSWDNTWANMRQLIVAQLRNHTQ